ncbi:MAG: hypothetical protein ACRD0W_21550 [Acidimicrobiales bacterium]
MAVNGYIDVVEFREWIDLDDALDDAVIDQAITAASRGIDNYCERHFWQTAAGTARVFDACDKWTLHIDDLVSIAELATDDGFDGTFGTVWVASDYQLLPLNPEAAPEPRPFDQIHAVASRAFPQPLTHNTRSGLVRVTGVWGWPAVPEGVIQACLLVVNRAIKRRTSPEGVAGFDEFGVIRISSRDDPDAVRHLDNYWDPASVGV